MAKVSSFADKFFAWFRFIAFPAANIPILLCQNQDIPIFIIDFRLLVEMAGVEPASKVLLFNQIYSNLFKNFSVSEFLKLYSYFKKKQAFLLTLLTIYYNINPVEKRCPTKANLAKFVLTIVICKNSLLFKSFVQYWKRFKCSK